MGNQKTVLVPQYLRQFSCIGSSCEDTCCAGWTVTVDRKTYKKYSRVLDPQLKPLLDKQIKRNRKNVNDENYAKIEFTPEGSCSLLSPDKLCSIQQKLGEDLLSNVCFTYPRTVNTVNGIIEKSLSVSCPEAARLALLNPNPMEFDEIEESAEQRNILIRRINTINPSEKAYQYFWDLRIFTIQLLQNRNYPLADRLIILGMFINTLQEYLEHDQTDKIPDLIHSQQRLLDANAFKEVLSDIPTSNHFQVQLAKELIQMRLTQGTPSIRFLQCIQAFAKGLNLSDKSTHEELNKRYEEAYRLYYLPYISKNEYIFENYLVNYVFKNLFPFASGKRVFEEFILMIVHFALMKLLLIGMAGYHKDNINSEHVLTLIQSFSKNVEHNQLYLRESLESLKKAGFSSIAHMAILIRN